MSFVIYGDNHTKRTLTALSVEDAYNLFIATETAYNIENYNFKIERLY